MIVNANKKLLSSCSGLPNMSNTIKGWFQPIIFKKVSYSVVNFEKVETIDIIDTQGVVQPAGQETLNLLAEGDRSWDVQEVHCLPNVQLKNGDFIEWNNTKYKVLSKQNYSCYGYMFYVIREAFEND